MNRPSQFSCVTAAARILFLLVAAPIAWAQPQYELIALPTFGGTSSEATGISANGLIVGWASYPSDGGAPAAMWDQDGNIFDLGSPPGGYYGRPHAVNDAGQVAATGEANPQTYQGFQWDGGVWTSTGTLSGNNESNAIDIDSFGRVVGQSFNLGPSGPDRAVLWDAGVMTDLGTLPGGSYSRAYGINDVGQIVGRGNTILPDGSGFNRAFIWENGAMTALEPLAGEVETEAFDVNEAGDVVGASWWLTSQFLHAKGATLWPSGSTEAIDLGYVPGPPGSCSSNPYWHKSIARAINNCGQIVGDAMCIASGASKDGFLWDNGVMYNLNDLIVSGDNLDITGARDINDAGQIVGLALDANDKLRAYLLQPLTPSPCNAIVGDIDGDGDVDLSDLATLLAAYNACDGDASFNPDADLDGSGCIDLSDLATLLANYGG